MQNIVYKTTNLLNGRFYVGVHKTSNPEVFDGYFGSNKLLKAAIKKYGRENFIRETLINCYEDAEEAYSIEAMLVKTVKEDPRSYNLEPGGIGNINFGKSVVALGIGIHGASFEERSEWSKTAQANMDQAKRLEMCSSGGKRCAELGKTGFQTRSKENAKLDALKALKTKIERNSYQAFKDSETQKRNGIKGGKATLGSRWYNDGIKNTKFKSSDPSNKEQTDLEFAEFIKDNSAFSRGRIKRSTFSIK